MAVASRVEKLVALSAPIWVAEKAAIWVSANSAESVVTTRAVGDGEA